MDGYRTLGRLCFHGLMGMMDVSSFAFHFATLLWHTTNTL